MKQSSIKRCRDRIITLLFGFAISVVLLIASFAKLSYPAGALKDFFLAVGIFEGLFAVCLIIFHRKRWIWDTAALVFAAWGGYALFWLLWGLPCACFGKMLQLSPGVSLGIDLVQYGAALCLSYMLGTKPKQIRFLIYFSIFLAIFGFILAYGLNNMLFLIEH